jgi:hypothetical protein
MSSTRTWQEQALSLAAVGHSWRQIAEKLGKSKSTVSDYLRKLGEQGIGVCAAWTRCASDDEYVEDNSRVLILSDMHIPYQHPGTIDFLGMLKDRYQPTRVICVGDELDKHAMSFHDSDPDLDSAGVELEKARAIIHQVEAMFPQMDLIDSNHGSMVHRKAKHHGIPSHYIKSYNDVLGVGPGWKWHYDLTIELPDGRPVYFHHGKAADGLKLSQSLGMSCVQGHYHEKFNVQYWGNSLGLYFSMQVGCLIDDDSLAFAYNNVNLKRPVIGTGLIVDGYPVLEPMPL